MESKNKTKFVLKNNLKHYYPPQGGIIRNRLAAGTNVQKDDTLYQLLTFGKKERKPSIIQYNRDKISSSRHNL